MVNFFAIFFTSSFSNITFVYFFIVHLIRKSLLGLGRTCVPTFTGSEGREILMLNGGIRGGGGREGRGSGGVV